MPALPLSTEQKEDAKRLEGAWLAYKQKTPGASQKKIADFFGFKSQSSVSQYVKGDIPLNIPVLKKFCDFFGVRPSEISPRLAAEIAGLSESVAESSQDAQMMAVLRQLDPEKKEMLIKMATGLIAPSIPMSSENYFKTGKGRGNPSHATDELSLPKDKNATKV